MPIVSLFVLLTVRLTIPVSGELILPRVWDTPVLGSDLFAQGGLFPGR